MDDFDFVDNWLKAFPYPRGARYAGTGKRKKFDNWFESCTLVQLKELCKASQLQVSGTKAELVERLMNSEVVSTHGAATHARLKEGLEALLVVQSGNKYDLVLRHLYCEFKTGSVKRAATKMVMNDETGELTEILKKRKVVPSPKVIYNRMTKAMNAVAKKKKYQHPSYGTKDHVRDVYYTMKMLIEKHCIEEKVVESDPRRAEEMSRAVFRAFYDNWHVMRRLNYECYAFRNALDVYAGILKAAGPLMSTSEIEAVVDLFESIEACSKMGHGIHLRTEQDDRVKYFAASTNVPKISESSASSDEKKRVGIPKKGDNAIMQTILIAMPQYDKSVRPEKEGKLLDIERQRFAGSVITSFHG